MTINNNRPVFFSDDIVQGTRQFKLVLRFHSPHDDLEICGTYRAGDMTYDYELPENLPYFVQLVIEWAFTDYEEIGKPCGDFESKLDEDEDPEDFEWVKGAWMLLAHESDRTPNPEHPKPTGRDPEEAICDFRDYCAECEDAGNPIAVIPEMHQWFIDALMGFENVADLEQRTICTMARLLGRESEVIEEVAEAATLHGVEHAKWLMGREHAELTLGYYAADDLAEAIDAQLIGNWYED